MKKIVFNGEECVNVVDTALITRVDVADGKHIPLVIIDTSNNEKIKNVIKCHVESESGEMVTTWGMTKDKEYVVLVLDSVHPIVSRLCIVFNLKEQYATIDRILKTNLLYIQCGKEGDRVFTPEEPIRILVEIPNTGFEEYWVNIKEKTQKARFKELGVKNKNLDSVIDMFNKEWDGVFDKHIMK